MSQIATKVRETIATEVATTTAAVTTPRVVTNSLVITTTIPVTTSRAQEVITTLRLINNIKVVIIIKITLRAMGIIEIEGLQGLIEIRTCRKGTGIVTVDNCTLV